MTLRAQLIAFGVISAICVGGALYWDGRRDEAKLAAPKIETADDNAAARGLEAQGAQESTERVEATLRAARAVQENTNALILEARAAGAGQALDPARADRLRAHDQFLCDAAPGACTPPQVTTPATAAETCQLYTLPADPTSVDLEVGYMVRGAQVLACEGKRQLAVETHAAEHRLEAEWARQRAERNRPWWRFW